jgi:two-component system, OmpR family, response regulator
LEIQAHYLKNGVPHWKAAVMRVLLIEDEVEVAEGISTKLIQSGFSTDKVSCLQDAKDALDANGYALVIIDRRLPDGDGISLVPQIRSRHGKSRILILTAYDQTQAVVSGLDSGADEYVTKPFHYDELMARIRTVLRRSGDEPSPTISVGALVFDPHLRNVSVDGRTVILHGRELMLLEVLIMNVGRMVSRRRLIDEIYGFSASVEPKAVNLVVMRLRRRLIDLGAGVEIHAARGVGYMLTKAQ